MNNTPDVSRRGVYYNLEISPYRFTTPDGEIFKFSSQKKLEIYTRRIDEIKDKIKKLLDKHEPYLGSEWVKLTEYIIEEKIYQRIYKEVEGV